VNPSGNTTNVQFTSTITAGAYTASGNVTFKTNGGVLSVNALNGSAVATSAATAALLRGTNTIIAEFAGDANVPGSTNTLLQVVTNHPPVVNDVTYMRATGLGMKITVTNLLSNVTDVDGDMPLFVGINSTNVGLTTDGTRIYVPTNNVDEQFTYTIHDGYLGTNSGTVHLVIVSVSGQGKTVTIDTNTQTATTTFYGIPGYTYVVQRATNIDFTLGVTNLSTNAIDIGTSDPAFSVTDNFSDLGVVPDSAFYRLLVP
jgi:hypothetical protein